MIRTIFAALCVVLATSAAAQYKWTDQNGKVQYGDVPPAGANATRLGAAPTPQAPATNTQDPKATANKPLTPAEQEAEFRKRQIDARKNEEKQAQAAYEAAVKKENCERAQEYLRTLDSGMRVSRTDAKGERAYLDDAQIAQEKAKARQNVQNWCS